MLRASVFAVSAIVALAACQPTDTQPKLGPDGLPLPKVYNITASDRSVIPQRVLESVNSLRSARGAAPLVLNDALTTAALAHSKDMAAQNRPWHWGSDGSSPLSRAQRAGYPGQVLGENISETYETEMETLSAWMKVADTRDVILNPAATQMGFSWYQEPSGKIWWTMVTGN
ncbi:serine protease [Thioclava sediminum]|uniref:Serine protease n=1 Tax=Thioclava sediminum TaxID=1915319 RepID=A0ABX3MX13_9RHOB|nr:MULTISPECIES: CAP domain-containing protein [Thioclava]OOY09107.1 serine protease [Thioclava sp. F36-7]OOY23060.1 serine protease [Thioclava sediminum]